MKTQPSQQRRIVEALIERRDGLRAPRHQPVERSAAKRDFAKTCRESQQYQ